VDPHPGSSTQGKSQSRNEENQNASRSKDLPGPRNETGRTPITVESKQVRDRINSNYGALFGALQLNKTFSTAELILDNERRLSIVQDSGLISGSGNRQ